MIGSNFFSEDMKKTMLKIRILHRIKKSRINAYMLLKEISARRKASTFFRGRKQMKIDDLKNDVYNTLNSLENSGYIKSTQKKEGGRIKHYYSVTNKGNAVLKSARTVFKKHMKEISSLFE